MQPKPPKCANPGAAWIDEGRLEKRREGERERERKKREKKEKKKREKERERETERGARRKTTNRNYKMKRRKEEGGRKKEGRRKEEGRKKEGRRKEEAEAAAEEEEKKMMMKKMMLMLMRRTRMRMRMRKRRRKRVLTGVIIILYYSHEGKDEVREVGHPLDRAGRRTLRYLRMPLGRRQRFSLWLQSNQYEILIAFVLCINVLWMALELQVSGQEVGAEIGVYRNNVQNEMDSWYKAFVAGDMVFTAFFCMDVIVRILVIRIFSDIGEDFHPFSPPIALSHWDILGPSCVFRVPKKDGNQVAKVW